MNTTAIAAAASSVLLAALALSQDTAQRVPDPKPWEAFELAELVRGAEAADKVWTPFLDRSTLSCGLYRLAQGGVDRQSPHELDEVYYVAKGRAKLEVDGETTTAEPGSILFVAAGKAHRFVEIEEALEVVVFFSKKTDADEHEDG